jgi:hypothetical protein
VAVARARVLHAYAATKPGELSLAKGDVVMLLDQSLDDWWRGEVRGQTGFFPRDYVTVLPRVGDAPWLAAPDEASTQREGVLLKRSETKVINTFQRRFCAIVGGFFRMGEKKVRDPHLPSLAAAPANA